jgi:hypothetical protein
MNKLIVALIASTFAMVAAAQTQAPMTKKEINAEKAKTVDSVTKSETDVTSGQNAAKGSAMAKTQKHQPKALPNKEAKREAVNAATKSGTDTDSGINAAKGSAMAKKEKGTPKALPTKEAKREAVDSATKKNATP